MSQNQNQKQQNQNPKQKQKQIEQLTKSDVEVLYQKRQIEKDGGEVELLDTSTADLIREVLGDPLSERGVRDTSTMRLETLARQYVDDEGSIEESISLESLSQTPESGGLEENEEVDADADADAEEFTIESLAPADVRMGHKRSKLISAMDGRCPERTQELREELCAELGIDDVDELPEPQAFADIVRG